MNLPVRSGSGTIGDSAATANGAQKTAAKWIIWMLGGTDNRFSFILSVDALQNMRNSIKFLKFAAKLNRDVLGFVQIFAAKTLYLLQPCAWERGMC